MDKLFGTHHAIKVGDYVEVLCEYAPGTCSDGGIGFIGKMDTGEDGTVYCTVSYVLDARIETRVEAHRITVTPMPYKDLACTTRSKKVVVAENVVELMPARVLPVPVRSPLEWLKYGLSLRTHEKRGWLREKLLHHNLLEPNVESLWKRVLSDYKCQLSAIEGMRLALGGMLSLTLVNLRGQMENSENLYLKSQQIKLMCLRICGRSHIYYIYFMLMTSNVATSRTKRTKTKRERQC